VTLSTLKVATNIFEKHAAYTFSINGSSVRVQSADMGRGKEGGQRGLWDGDRTQSRPRTAVNRQYEKLHSGNGPCKGTMYHHMRSIKNGKRRPHWMESGNIVQRLGSIFL